MEMRLPVIRRQFGFASTTMWLSTDQIECDSPIPGKLAVFGQSLNIEKRFSPCLPTLLEWVSHNQ